MIFDFQILNLFRISIFGFRIFNTSRFALIVVQPSPFALHASPRSHLRVWFRRLADAVVVGGGERAAVDTSVDETEVSGGFLGGDGVLARGDSKKRAPRTDRAMAAALDSHGDRRLRRTRAVGTVLGRPRRAIGGRRTDA